jgi:ABC-type lipoprotein release transport system permease subunit
MLIKVAWRNVWRNRARSGVIVLSVAIGLWAGIFMVGFYHGMIRQRIRSVIERETSHIQIHHPSFAEDHDLGYDIGPKDSILQRLPTGASVRAAAQRTVCHGMAATPSGSSGVKINGVEPDAEAAITGLSKDVDTGSYFKPGGRNEVLIGARLAKKLRLVVGRKMVLTTEDREGNLSSGAFRVVGVFRTVNASHDETDVYIRIPDADVLGAMEGNVNEIAILLNEDKSVDSAAAGLRRAMPRLRVETWTEINPEMQLLVSTNNQVLVIFMGIILLALAFGIVNTMLMSVLERTREIGMLLSLGMSRMRVFIMILLETLFLVMVGCPAGIVPGLLTVGYLSRRGIDLSRYMEALSSFGWDFMVYPSLEWRQVLTIIGLVVFTALLSSLFPARRALSLKPAEAIRK